MNALELMKQDHAELKKMMGQLESTTERGVKTREHRPREPDGAAKGYCGSLMHRLIASR